jgi:hypothetical protein
MSRWTQFFIALGIGIAAGIFYGWKVAPVSYVDTTPDTLREDYRVEYVLMVAETFESEEDLEAAARRLAFLGAAPPSEIVSQALTFARENHYSPEDIAALEALYPAMERWGTSREGDISP